MTTPVNGDDIPHKEIVDKSVTAIVKFTYKGLGDHIVGVFSEVGQIFLSFLYSLGILWLVLETAIQFVDTDVRGWRLYCLLLGVSAAIAVVIRVVQYQKECPQGFEGRSQRSRQLAHLQPPFWEPALVRSLMAELIIPIDRECRDLLAGREFVIARKPSDFEEYHRWIVDRLANLNVMMQVSLHLLTDGLAEVLSKNSKPADKAIEILGWVESVARLYRESVRFERQSRAVLVPSGLKPLHELLQDWSDPVRDAVRQCFTRLDVLCSADLDSSEKPCLDITYKSPPGVAKLEAELARLEQSGFRFLDEW